MAKIRIGLGSEFNLNNGNLGLGVTNPQVRLDVDGTVKSKDFEVTGVTSFTAYEGFLRSDHQIDGDLTLNTGQGLNASLSGEIIIKDGTTVTVGAIGLGTTSVGVGTELITNTIDSNAVNLAGGSEIECLKVYNTFTPPSGGTNERPEAPKPGELYYNYDLKTIEFHDGYGWRQVNNTTRSGRGVFAGGQPAPSSKIEYVNIHTLGNGINFGNLANTGSRTNLDGFSSSIRGVFIGGTYTTDMDYITIASEGNAIDFGNLTQPAGYVQGVSSSTRGVRIGGFGPSPGTLPQDTIDYVEIATTGSAIDFGDLFTGRYNHGACQSPTRAVVYAGFSNNSGARITGAASMEAFNIASKGDSSGFGEANATRGLIQNGASNAVRGFFAGGSNPDLTKEISAVTISSFGSAFNFGDLSSDRQRPSSAASNTRVIFAGGATPTVTNVIEFITIASAGDAIDFGDLIDGTNYTKGSCSDSHGGLGGF